MFHRRYSSLGYATLLLETGPGMSRDSKQRSYRAAILSVSSALLTDQSFDQVMSPASASFEVAAVAPYLEPLPGPYPGPSPGLLIAVVLCAYAVLVYVIRSSGRTREIVWSRKYRRCLVDTDVPLNPLASRRTPQPITSRS